MGSGLTAAGAPLEVMPWAHAEDNNHVSVRSDTPRGTWLAWLYQLSPRWTEGTIKIGVRSSRDA